MKTLKKLLKMVDGQYNLAYECFNLAEHEGDIHKMNEFNGEMNAYGYVQRMLMNAIIKELGVKNND